MKESIDLTENRDFRGNGIKLQRKYNHNKLPWIKAESDEPAEKQTGIKLYSKNVFNYYPTSTTLNNSLNIWANDSAQLSVNLDGYNITSTDTFIDEYNFTSNSTNFKFYCNKNNGSIYYNYSNSENLSVFPTGRRDYIKSHRIIPNGINNNYKPKYKICKKCGEKILNTLWNEQFFYCVLCEKINRKRFINNNPYRNSAYGTVPSLSSKIPAEKAKKKIPKRYIEWRYYNDVYDDPDDLLLRNKRKSYVYYKGRELRRREEPWQPKGRVSQDYDKMFDNTDWRDLLKKRIGVLERDSVLLTEKKCY